MGFYVVQPLAVVVGIDGDPSVILCEHLPSCFLQPLSVASC